MTDHDPIARDLALTREAMRHRDVTLEGDAHARAWAELQRAIHTDVRGDVRPSSSVAAARTDRGLRPFERGARAPVARTRLAVLGAGIAAATLGVGLWLGAEAPAPSSEAHVAIGGAGVGPRGPIPLNGTSRSEVAFEAPAGLRDPTAPWRFEAEHEVLVEAPWATWRTPPIALDLEAPNVLAQRIHRTLVPRASTATRVESGARATGGALEARDEGELEARDAGALEARVDGEPDTRSELDARSASASASARLDEARRWVSSDAPRARAIAEEVLDARPAAALEMRARMLIADALRREGDRARAAATYGLVAESEGPFLEEALLRQAQLYTELGRFDEATRVLDAADVRVRRGLLLPERAALRARLAALREHTPRGASRE